MLYGALLGALIFDLIGGLGGGLLFGLTFALIGALIGGLYNLASHQELQSLRRVRLRVWLISALIGALLAGALGWQIGALNVGLRVWLIFALIGSLGGALNVGLSNELSGGLIKSRRSTEAEIKLKANQGVWQSLKNGLFFGLFFGLIGGLIFAMIFPLIGGLNSGLIFAMIGGLSGGLNDCIQHFVLRWMLYRNNRMPFNYARFLDYCVDRIFLRRVGGGYIFIHRLVMEHFASLTNEDIDRIAGSVRPN